MIKLTWTATIGLLALAGCATTPPPKPPPGKTPLQQAFLESSREVASSVRTLSEIRNAQLLNDDQSPGLKQERINADHLPAGLDKPISLEWHGEALPALKLIAQLTDYGSVRPYGTPPQGGAVVKIRAKARPAYDIIRDIGAQLGRRAEIRVLPQGQGDHGVIEVFFRGGHDS